MLKLRMVDRNILDHYTDLPVGEVLRRVRVQFGLELPYVAAHLNIRPEHLAAIEAGDMSRLPGRVYAIGFVRTYAEYLKLDSDKIVYLFKSQVIGHTIPRDLSFPIPQTETRSPAWWMVAASITTLAIIGALFLWLGGTKADTEAKPDLPVAAAQTKPAEKPASAADTDADAPIAQGAGKLKITALQPSWVEVRSSDDPDSILFSRVLKAGESYTAPDLDNLVLSTGNADGVSVSWDGKKVDVFEGRHGIVRNLPVSGLSAYKVQAGQTAPRTLEPAAKALKPAGKTVNPAPAAADPAPEKAPETAPETAKDAGPAPITRLTPNQ